MEGAYRLYKWVAIPSITPGLSTLIRRMMVSLCPEQGRRGSNQILFTDQMVTDGLTKPLDAGEFLRSRSVMGLNPAEHGAGE